MSSFYGRIQIQKESPSVIESKNITENGTYIASEGVDGYSPVIVDVPNSYNTSDEGKVVNNGELVAQGNQIITENGTYDTTLVNELIANIAGGSGGEEVDFYAIKYTPNSNGITSRSAGWRFTTDFNTKVKGVRFFARETTASVYISDTQGNTIASKTNVTVIADQWNDVLFDNPITLSANTDYVVWGSHATVAMKYRSGIVSSPLITYIGGCYSTSYSTFPSTNDDSNIYGVDLIIAVGGGGATLISKTITQNGTYNAEDDNADGYSEVIVEVPEEIIAEVEKTVNEYAYDYVPTSDTQAVKSGGFEFKTTKKIKISKLRVFPLTTIVNAYITQDETIVASIENATVIANQWNDLELNESVILEPNVNYIIWYTTNDVPLKYKNGSLISEKQYITYIDGRYSTIVNTRPVHSTDDTYAVDFYIDSYFEEGEAILISTPISSNVKNILKGVNAPTASIGSDGDIYLLHLDASGKLLSYLRTHNKAISVTLSNWIYRTSDKIVFKFKNAGSHSNMWGRFINVTDTSMLTVNYNLWGNRNVLNVRRNGTYSGDNAYVFNSPSNTIKYYQFTLDENGFEMLSGFERDNYLDTEVKAVFGTVTDADTTNPTLFQADGSNALDIEFHELAVFRNDVLIHDYYPVAGGIKDIVDNTMFTVTDPDVTYGEVLAPVVRHTYCKVNGSWQALEGTDINDVKTEI